MGIARNIARLIPNGSGLLPNANIEAVAASKLTGQVALATQVSGTLPDANAPSGSVIQVVSTTKTDVFSTGAGAGFTDVAGFSVTITPTSASNKILILASFTFAGTGNSYSRLMRNSTAIFIGDARGSRDRVSTGDGYTGGVDNSNMSNSITHLDSPSTTSATTYKLQIRPENIGSSYNVWFNATRSDPDQFNRPTYASTITAMEIAA